MDADPPNRRLLSGGLIAAGLGLSLTLLFLVAALGASVVEPRLPGTGHLPPWTLLGAKPDPLGVVVLVVVALGVGGLAVLQGLRALRSGWRPRPSRLLAAGILAVAALSLVPATGSADPESYAAYGRMAHIGRDPYVTTPNDMVRIGDPVAPAVEDPWKDTPSVYGPLATAEQRLAASIGHRSVRTTVEMLVLLNTLAFLATGLLLYFFAPDEAARRRAALLWMLNPLLLYELVSGAHVDAVMTMFCVAGVLLVSRSRLAAGALLGCAVAVKLPALAVLAGVVWVCRHSMRSMLSLVGSAFAVLALAYSTVSVHAFGRTFDAGSLASWATPWRGLISLLDATVGRPGSRTAMAFVALVIGAAFAIALLRRESRPATTDPVGVARAAAAAGFACYFGYLLAAPYALPWYDAPAWGLLAVMAPSAYDLLLAARTTAMAAAYVTHDEPHLPGNVHAVVVALRNVVSPIVLAGVVIWTIVVLRRPAQATSPS